MRIIAGSAGGRRFEAPQGLDTRPTLDRVKEAVFGAVQFGLAGSTVLDLFSGSGNLGLEAASRGAARVYCNDHAAACASLIRQNAARLGLQERVRVTQLDYRAAVARYAEEKLVFDYAFLDAPYADGTALAAAELLASEGLMAENGLILLEHSAASVPAPKPALLALVRTRRYGKCAVSTLKGNLRP